MTHLHQSTTVSGRPVCSCGWRGQPVDGDRHDQLRLAAGLWDLHARPVACRAVGHDHEWPDLLCRWCGSSPRWTL